jgi:predicted phage terminase large subunit-like protein
MPGEMLWPEWYTADMYPKNPDVAQALYQNNPTPSEGNYFRKDDLVEYGPGELPKLAKLRIYVGSDYAVTKTSSNDKTAIVIGGLDENGRLWIVDWTWDWLKTDETVDKSIEIGKQYRPLLWGAERGQISHAIGPFFLQRQVESGYFLPMEELVSSADKEARATSIRGRTRQRMVLFPRFHPQWAGVKHQLLSFPKGTEDDWVDAISNLGRLLADMVSPKREVDNDPKPLIDGGPKLTLKWLKNSHTAREKQLASK